MDDERLGARRWMRKVREVRAMTTTNANDWIGAQFRGELTTTTTTTATSARGEANAR